MTGWYKGHDLIAAGGRDGAGYNCGMTAERFEQLFDALGNRSPLKPFTVELVGGDRFEVDDPRAMVVRVLEARWRTRLIRS
jgi:hypothetical protein